MGFLKRLGVGLVKGLLVGLLVGGTLQLGLGWTEAAGLLGYLLAMGTGATAGILAGTPPWKGEAWIEALLKGFFGLGVGALLYWLASSFASFDLPFPLAGARAGASWTALPILYAPLIGALYGAVVELDNTEGKARGDEKGAPEKKPARA